MKIVRLIIKIFNCVIIAISAVATVFLFASPSLSFNSRIDVNVEKLSEFIPKNDYSDEIKIVDSLGTDTISVSLKFKIHAGDVSKIMKNDRNRINEVLIDNNIKNIADELYEPVRLITEHSVLSVIESVSKKEITKQVEDARDKYKESHPDTDVSTDSLMAMLKLTPEKFKAFATNLYETSNSNDATITAVNNVLIGQIDEVMVRANKLGDSSKMDTSSYSENAKNQIKENVTKVYTQLNLFKEDNIHLEKISDVAFIYLTSFIKKDLIEKKGTSESLLSRGANETIEDYTDRLLGIYVDEQMPDVFYKAVRGVGVGLFIGLFIFTLTWVGLAVVTILRTFVTKKTWTFFGPWFWLVGILQVILGFVLTYVGKVTLANKFDISQFNLPISKVLVAPRTYALVPSILFCVCVGLAIAYTVLKILFKKKLKEEDSKAKEKEAA